MPACIFLLPNSLPSSNEIKALGKDAYPPVLRNFLEGFGEPKVATIFENPALSGFASMQWVWMLLTQRENLAPSAPYLWKGLGGPKVHQEFWALNGYRKENGVLKSAGDVFDIDEECDLRDLLNPIARQFNFEVQVLDGRFFLARKKAWQVLITPWLAQEDKPAAQPAGPKPLNGLKSLESSKKVLQKAFSMNTEQKPDGLRLKVSGSTAELLRSSFFPILRFAVL